MLMIQINIVNKNIINFLRQEITTLMLFIIIFILIRSVNFTYHLNFSQDQAWFSTEALNIIKNNKHTLIGPHISFIYDGRKVFQGSIIFYFQSIFLTLGKFDPIISSYLYMIFNSLLILPLYYGIKLLTNKKLAVFVTIIYVMLPLYINYSRFFWNPNFQFSMLPILFLLMGFFKRKKNVLNFFWVSLFSGIIVQFHYQFFLILLSLLVYYFFIQKLKLKFLFFFILGFLIGFSPLIIFELRHNFYNIRTLILYYQNLNQIPAQNDTRLLEAPHYFLSISFFIILVGFYFLRNKLNTFIHCILLISLFIWSAVLYFPKPLQGYGMAKNWNYPNEEKVYKIILSSNIENYNIINQIYNTTAEVQKYLHRKDNFYFDFDNYKDNSYLFVITGKNNFLDDEAYEIKYFQPNKLINSWNISKVYKLYLLKKLVLQANMN